MSVYDSSLFQELKGKADPAWLWDWARGRIVWANHPGITFWGESSLFDLLDHRFDPDSATLKKIRDIFEKLEAGDGAGDEVIFFPEAGQLVKCRCTITRLEDGRNGLLIAAARTGGNKAPAAEGLMEQIVAHTPFALALLDRAGRLVFANPALKSNLSPSDPEAEAGAGGGQFALAEWLGGEDVAHKLVSRILLVGSHSEARILKTRYGKRTHRITARRIGAEDGETTILMVLQDIEDRRNYERALQARLEKLERGDEPETASETGEEASEAPNAEESESKLPITAEVKSADEAEGKSTDEAEGKSTKPGAAPIAGAVAAAAGLGVASPVLAKLLQDTEPETDAPAETDRDGPADRTGEGETEPETEAVAEPETETVPETEPEAETEQEAAAEHEAEAETEPETVPETAAQDAEQETVAATGDEGEPAPEDRAASETGLAAELLPEAAFGAEPEAEATADDESEPTPETREAPEAVSAARLLPEAAFGAEPKGAAEDAPADVSEAGAEEEAEPEAEAPQVLEAESEAEPEAAADSEAGRQAEPEKAERESEAAPLARIAGEEEADSADSDEEREEAYRLHGRDKEAFTAIAEALRLNNPATAEQIRIGKGSEIIELAETHGGADEAGDEDKPDQPPVPEQPEGSEAAETAGPSEAEPEPDTEPEGESAAETEPEREQEPEPETEAAGVAAGVTLAGTAAASMAEIPQGPAGGHQLKLILDSAVDGIVTLDGKGQICDMNASAETMLGVSSAEMAGRPFTELLSEGSARVTQSYLEAVNETGVAGPFRDGREIEARTKQGDALPLFLTVGPVTSDDRLEYCAVIRDISHWKNAEKELRQAKERAEQDNEKKSDFLARISHELRTPLNAIMGFSEVMSEEKFGPIANDRYKGYVSDIRNSSEHLLSLVNDLLDLSKIESGHLEMNFTSVDLSSIVGQCAALMQPQATRERIVMRSSIPDNLPPVVADHRSLRQIVLNLLSNAVKFTRAGGQVIVSALLGEDGEVRLQVRDTGIGMDAEELKKAMEPYRQIRAVNESGLPGTGLGLPLTKALAEANRAEFHISSEKDKGTLVQIVFPTTRVLAE